MTESRDCGKEIGPEIGSFLNNKRTESARERNTLERREIRWPGGILAEGGQATALFYAKRRIGSEFAAVGFRHHNVFDGPTAVCFEVFYIP